MAERRPYLSDPSDEQWALIEPVIRAWKQRHPSVSGHQGRYAMREIVNAILYQARTRCQWRYLPHDLPPHTAVYYYFAVWRDDGTDQTIHDLLRCQVRERAGREEDPSAVVLDTQTCGPRSAPPPRRRDWMRARRAGAASVHDNAIGIGLLDKVSIDNPSVTTAWVDAGFTNAVATYGAGLGIQVAVVSRDRGTRGFARLPKRWVVERAYGTLMLHRRLVRDYERRLASSESMLYWGRFILNSLVAGGGLGVVWCEWAVDGGAGGWRSFAGGVLAVASTVGGAG
ncbi:transposase [Actinomadura sp. 9N215]|uniref:transposase n=1 Tax=Actinomadura sp. 9N215 TaxID=3375150 RepID=UPI0037BACEAB